MPIKTMEELSAVPVGGKVEVGDAPYWRVSEGFWSPVDGGQPVVRDRFFEGYVASGEVLSEGEVRWRPGLVYERPGEWLGVLVEPGEKSGQWVVERFKLDGTYKDQSKTAEVSKLKGWLLDPQPNAQVITVLLAQSKARTEALAQIAAFKAQTEATLKRALDAESVLAGFKTGLAEFKTVLSTVTEFEPGTVTGISSDGGTGLKVGERLRNKADADAFLPGTVITHDTSGNVYTKQEDQTWTRRDSGRRYASGELTTKNRYIVVEFPAPVPVADPKTGLKVGDLVMTSQEFAELPVGTVVEYPADAPTQRWEKFAKGGWNQQGIGVTRGRSETLAAGGRNRIIELPL